MRFAGFIGASYVSRSVNVDCQRCINLYPEVTESQSGKEREVMSLIQTPGLIAFANLGENPVRGMWTDSKYGRTFAVCGNKAYELNSDGTTDELGTLTTSSGPVSMADNGLTVAIADGSKGYAITLSNSTLAQITDPDFISNPKQVVCIDGFFLFISDTLMQMSEFPLSVDFNALDVRESEGLPDKIVAMIADHRDAWLFNEQSIEIYQNVGSTIDPNSGLATFPFERMAGGFMEVGCIAPFSVAKMNSSVFWLGRTREGSGMVYMAQGYQPQRISTHAVERAIQSYGDVSDARAYCYQMDGHFFYVLNFTNADTTWVFDVSTGLWHERTYLNQGALERHRAQTHTFAFAKHLVGDYATGLVYEMSPDVYTDNGAPMLLRRRSPHSSKGGLLVSYPMFQLDIESGTGLDGIQQGTDPQAILRISKDGGHTWTTEQWRSFGKIGQRKRRAIWRRLGASRDAVFEITITDPVRVTIIGAELGEPQIGAS